MSKIQESMERKDEKQATEIALPCAGAGTAGAGSPGEYV